MVYATSRDRVAGAPAGTPTAVKILVAGGFGAGKTTFVGAVSEIRPLRTEAVLTAASLGVDDTQAVGSKTTTTVAMDFGRITIADDVVLYVFGTPGQDRFWFMWDELSLGAIGVVVLADTRRLADCFPALDYFERAGLPMLVAVNRFDGAQQYDSEDIREALDLDVAVPVVFCDARRRESTKATLIGLVEHALVRATAAVAR